MNQKHISTRKKIIRYADILADRFIQRWDSYALQLNDGRYVCIKKPLKHWQIDQHLKGQITLGTYVLNKNSEARFTVIDADDDNQYHQLFRLTNILFKSGIPSYLEASRRGGHLWFFFEKPVPGLKAKRFGEDLLADYHLEPMEVFPKQTELTTGPGSLIRLPFGVHKKSGKVYPFVNIPDGLPISTDSHEQIFMLKDVKMVTLETLNHYSAEDIGPEARNKVDWSAGAKNNIWERIRKSTPAIDFIGRYIELTPTETGSIGYCPFHDDNVKSFGVHRLGNFWRCFAGCGGGSIIDFWMMWKKVELGKAVYELKEMLNVD